jgi:hypothetical protein
LPRVGLKSTGTFPLELFREKEKRKKKEKTIQMVAPSASRRTLVLFLAMFGCGLTVGTADAGYHHPRFHQRWHGHGAHGAYPHRYRPQGGRNTREWRAPKIPKIPKMSKMSKMQQMQEMRQARQAHHEHRRASEHTAPRALHGGRTGETITELPDSLLVRIPGYQGETFDVRLDGATVVIRSLSRTRVRGYGYTRRLQLPANALRNKVTATHLRGSGIEIRIPTVVAAAANKAPNGASPASSSAAGAQTKANTTTNNQARRTTLADRLNRGWDDPEGSLIEDDYKLSSDVLNDGGPLQIIDMESSISYAKDENAVSGYIDVRGAWQSY